MCLKCALGLLEIFFSVVNVYEKMAPSFLRTRALDWCYAVLQKEDEFTNYIDIGPVNKMINMLAVYVREGKDSAAFRNHVYRVRGRVCCCRGYIYWVGARFYRCVCVCVVHVGVGVVDVSVEIVPWLYLLGE